MTASVWEGSRGVTELSGFSRMWCHPTLPGRAARPPAYVSQALSALPTTAPRAALPCSAFSCDRSATCQVTPDGKTR